MIKAPKIGIAATVNPETEEIKEGIIVCVMSATRTVDMTRLGRLIHVEP